MKYIKQILIILTISFVGELLKQLLPLPVPASIYGMVILFVLLLTKVIKLEAVKEVGDFMIEIMPVMFIPDGILGCFAAHAGTGEHYYCDFPCPGDGIWRQNNSVYHPKRKKENREERTGLKQARRSAQKWRLK